MRLLAIKLLNDNSNIPSKYMVWPLLLDERPIHTPDDVRDEAEGLPGPWCFDEKLAQYPQVEICECCGREWE